MSDAPGEVTPQAPKRSAAQVQQDYARLCTQAGEKQFMKAVIEAELQQMNQQIATLRNEYNEAQKQAEEESKKKSETTESIAFSSSTGDASTSSDASVESSQSNTSTALADQPPASELAAQVESNGEPGV